MFNPKLLEIFRRDGDLFNLRFMLDVVARENHFYKQEESEINNFLAHTKSRVNDPSLFSEITAEAIGKGQKITGEFCVLSIDISGMKIANDILGKEFVDKVLNDYLSAMREVFGEAGTIRFGGDEFVVIFNHQSDQQSSELINNFYEKCLQIRDNHFNSENSESIQAIDEKFQTRKILDFLVEEQKKKPESATRKEDVLVTLNTQDKEALINNAIKQFKQKLVTIIENLSGVELSEFEKDFDLHMLLSRAAFKILNSDNIESGLGISKQRLDSQRALGLYVHANVISTAQFDLLDIAIQKGDVEIQSKKSNFNSSKVTLPLEHVESTKSDETENSDFSSSNIDLTPIGSVINELNNELKTGQNINLIEFYLELIKCLDPQLDFKAFRLNILPKLFGSLEVSPNISGELFVIKIEQPYFGIMNKLYGSMEADHHFETFFNIVTRDLQDFEAFRDGGAVYIVCNEKNANQKLLVKNLEDAAKQIQYVYSSGEKTISVEFELAKMKALKDSVDEKASSADATPRISYMSIPVPPLNPNDRMRYKDLFEIFNGQTSYRWKDITYVPVDADRGVNLMSNRVVVELPFDRNKAA
jgi:diguanylate cyclase (GGDEF)-like protein